MVPSSCPMAGWSLSVGRHGIATPNTPTTSRCWRREWLRARSPGGPGHTRLDQAGGITGPASVRYSMTRSIAMTPNGRFLALRRHVQIDIVDLLGTAPRVQIDAPEHAVFAWI